MTTQKDRAAAIRAEEQEALYRQQNPAAAAWAAGYGVISHTTETQARVYQMAELLAARGIQGDGVPLFELLAAADRIVSAAMWLVVHQTYVQHVYLDGRDLAATDFKPHPEGHTGGSLNMVPAYIGYMTANAISGLTRSWIMGQGHCVAAIDSVNLILANMTVAHAARYSLTDAGLTRYAQDFYSYRLGADGKQDSPLGSHVNANTAGGLVEGGYLGFTELQYVHMPLPGERLVAFLSDGAFEEQRGSDWTGRWWRGEDCGLVTPIMINNGRRIDQETTMAQEGGAEWFTQHLRLNGFDPIVFDGRDPAAFAWAIFEMENRLLAEAQAMAESGEGCYNVCLPYGVACAPKGAGFYGEGTNLAHNLPLGANPHDDVSAAHNFNERARCLWVPPAELEEAIAAFQHHSAAGRPRERDHALAHREVTLPELPPTLSRPVSDTRQDSSTWTRHSPMAAVDDMFLQTCEANPHLRPRVGNPDEMRSNRMTDTLETLKFRVVCPEPGIPESHHGAVITALNEEAVANAALANKGGINLIVTYEAFATKMHGAMRQEIIFANHLSEGGRPQHWLSVPLVLTSHAWENGKNEQSHQDTMMAEAMMNEASNVSRVLFPADYNTAAAAMNSVYQSQGQFWIMVVAKADTVANLFTAAEANQLIAEGAMRLDWAGYQHDASRLVLTAIGAYQLAETLRASARLADYRIPHTVVYMLEPGRFRQPRSEGEQAHLASPSLRDTLYPASATARVFVTHTHPEPLLGTLQPLNTGPQTAALGFINQGGTLNTAGMLFINRATWAHIVQAAASVLGLSAEELFSAAERDALAGKANPTGIIIPPADQQEVSR
jgi:phosphoketolase